ncbi:MAG: alpha-galactosidase [Clostridia bacterium]|nr:alpha-galactosidase [Clostridia bacterium]
MDIIYIQNNQFQLNTLNTSYVMHNENGVLCHTYYGQRLPDMDHGYMAKRCRYNGDFQSNISENVPTLDNALLEYPVFGDGGITHPALEVLNADGTNFVDLRVVDYIVHNGKPAIDDLPASYCENGDKVKTLEIKTKDEVSGVEARLFYAVFYDYDVITRWVKITNNGKNAITLLKALSGNIAFDNKNYDVITNFGTWARERQIERAPLLHSGAIVESNCGSSSHYANPFIIMAEHNTTEHSGESIGIALAYSGNHKMSANLSRYNVVNLSAGISPDNFRWNLEQGESFSTPELVISFSGNGLNGLSQNFHTLIKNRVCRGIYRDKKRPVLLNLWEACYFDFTDETIKKAADSAADLGIELLVIDDGWFGKRNNDHTSLGDWNVNEDKIKCGLADLCEYVNSKGLMLGIWFEPEMVSPESELIKKHPEWVMQIRGRKPTETRWQLMLDLTNPEVCDFVYDSVAYVLKNTNIQYVKWDYNRTMAHIGSAYLKAEQMGEYYHRYILGLYGVLDRLTTDFPNVLFEGCASGGGRFDIGMLYYTPQIWTSDDTDAVERVEIQYGTSLIYPMSCQSAHVSVCPNHQTGRTVSMQARHIFALTGSFGYELAPEKIADNDREYIKEFIKFYNDNFDVFQSGKYYRLTNPTNDDFAVFQYVYNGRVIVGAMQMSNHAVNLQNTVRLKGLEPNGIYLNKATGKKYCGSQLMQFGLPLNVCTGKNDYCAFVWDLSLCD